MGQFSPTHEVKLAGMIITKCKNRLALCRVLKEKVMTLRQAVDIGSLLNTFNFV
jgi:hypothetical protein